MHLHSKETNRIFKFCSVSGFESVFMVNNDDTIFFSCVVSSIPAYSQLISIMRFISLPLLNPVGGNVFPKPLKYALTLTLLWYHGKGYIDSTMGSV